jgi:hypothetical protein
MSRSGATPSSAELDKWMLIDAPGSRGVFLMDSRIVSEDDQPVLSLSLEQAKGLLQPTQVYG